MIRYIFYKQNIILYIQNFEFIIISLFISEIQKQSCKHLIRNGVIIFFILLFLYKSLDCIILYLSFLLMIKFREFFTNHLTNIITSIHELTLCHMSKNVNSSVYVVKNIFHVLFPLFHQLFLFEIDFLLGGDKSES